MFLHFPKQNNQERKYLTHKNFNSEIGNLTLKYLLGVLFASSKKCLVKICRVVKKNILFLSLSYQLKCSRSYFLQNGTKFIPFFN